MFPLALDWVTLWTYLDQKESFIKEVELPPSIIDTNGIDILAKEQRQVRRERLHHESIGANAVGRELGKFPTGKEQSSRGRWNVEVA